MNNLAVAPALRPFVMGYKAIFSSMLAPFFYFFFAVFPVRAPIDRRSPLAEMGVDNHWDVFRYIRFSDWPDVSSAAVSRYCGKYSVRKDYFYYYDNALFVLGMLSLGMNFAQGHDPEVREKNSRYFLGLGVWHHSKSAPGRRGEFFWISNGYFPCHLPSLASFSFPSFICIRCGQAPSP